MKTEGGRPLPFELSEAHVDADEDGHLRLVATGTVERSLPSGTSIAVRASCQDEGHTLRLVDATNPHLTGDRELGDTTELSAPLFFGTSERPEPPCQFDFRVSPLGDAGDVFAYACYDGSRTQLGPCNVQDGFSSASSAGPPLEVAKLWISDGMPASSPRLDVTYTVRVGAPQKNTPSLVVKASCQVGALTIADWHTPSFMGELEYEPGAAFSRTAKLFDDEAYALTAPPSECRIEVAQWSLKRNTWARYRKSVLYSGCYRDQKLHRGACRPEDSEVSEHRERQKLTRRSVLVDDVELVVGQHANKQFYVEGSASIRMKVPNDQLLPAVSARTVCKLGRSSRETSSILTSSGALMYLDPGEVKRSSWTAFSSVRERPEQCSTSVTVSNVDPPLHLGRWCLRDGETAPCAKRRRPRSR